MGEQSRYQILLAVDNERDGARAHDRDVVLGERDGAGGQRYRAAGQGRQIDCAAGRCIVGGEAQRSCLRDDIAAAGLVAGIDCPGCRRCDSRLGTDRKHAGDADRERSAAGS